MRFIHRTGPPVTVSIPPTGAPEPTRPADARLRAWGEGRLVFGSTRVGTSDTGEWVRRSRGRQVAASLLEVVGARNAAHAMRPADIRGAVHRAGLAVGRCSCRSLSRWGSGRRGILPCTGSGAGASGHGQRSLRRRGPTTPAPLGSRTPAVSARSGGAAGVPSGGWPRVVRRTLGERRVVSVVTKVLDRRVPGRDKDPLPWLRFSSSPWSSLLRCCCTSTPAGAAAATGPGRPRAASGVEAARHPA